MLIIIVVSGLRLIALPTCLGKECFNCEPTPNNLLTGLPSTANIPINFLNGATSAGPAPSGFAIKFATKLKNSPVTVGFAGIAPKPKFKLLTLNSLILSISLIASST